jgi:hypothetical protein
MNNSILALSFIALLSSLPMVAGESGGFGSMPMATMFQLTINNNSQEVASVKIFYKDPKSNYDRKVAIGESELLTIYPKDLSTITVTTGNKTKTLTNNDFSNGSKTITLE